METVIGLFDREANLSNLRFKLRSIGCIDSDLAIITEFALVKALVSHYHQIGRYVFQGLVGGAILGALSYGLIAALHGFSMLLGTYNLAANWVSDLIAFTLVGAVIGILSCWLVGLNKLEQDVELYCDVLAKGGEVVALWVEEEKVTTVINFMRQENAITITTGHYRLDNLLHQPS